MLFIVLLAAAPFVFIAALFCAAFSVYYVIALARGLAQPYYEYTPDSNANVMTDVYTVTTRQPTHGRDNYDYDNDYEAD